MADSTYFETSVPGDTSVSSANPLPVTTGASSGVAASNLANAQVTGTTAGTTALVAARATRRSVTIKNISAANTAWIGVATVTSANGMPLYPGESIALDFTGALEMIDTGGAVVVAYADVYN